jgi:hypothetical protein
VYAARDPKIYRRWRRVMTLDEVKEIYPKLAVQLPENIFTDRELVVVDHNYEEADGEETGEFDPSEYNYIIYIAMPMLKILGEEGLAELTEKLKIFVGFSHFVASEEDLFGVQTDLGENEIIEVLFTVIEEIV